MDAGKTCVVVLVEGLPTDPSGACSAWAVASRIRGKHTGVSVCPDVVCYLTLHGATQHANRFQPLFGERGGIKCHIAGTARSIQPPHFQYCARDSQASRGRATVAGAKSTDDPS